MCDFGKEFLSSQLFGIILGALLTGGFTWFLEWRKYVAEQKNHLREKREEIYLKMLNILYILRNEALNTNNKDITQLRKQEINECYALINMYASKNVKEKYNLTTKNIDLFFMKAPKDPAILETSVNSVDVFINLIRKELGIKD